MDAKVPQRIDMEDRVIGPLTLQQFFYLLMGGLIIYILNSWIPSSSIIRPIFYIIAVPVAVLSTALAFVKIQDRPLIFFLNALIRYVVKPRRRVWLRGKYNKQQVIVSRPAEKKEETPRKEFDPLKAADAAKIVDTKDNA